MAAKSAARKRAGASLFSRCAHRHDPVLLKPSSDTGAQVIIHGRAIGAMEARSYHDYKTVAMNAVLESYRRCVRNTM